MLRESKGPKSSGSILFLVPIARIEESIRKVGEPDTVIKATGTAAVFPSVTSLARLGGKIVIGGVPEDVVEFSSLSIFRKELTVLLAKGSFPYLNPNGGSMALEYRGTGDLPVDGLVGVFSFNRRKRPSTRPPTRRF